MTAPRVATVTAAQRAVIGELTRDGASNRIIARRLFIAEETVKSHLRAALAATGCPNWTALAVALLRGQVRLRTIDTGRWVAREAAA